jgi:predicted transport protein
MAFLQEEDREIRRVLYDINTLKVNVAYPFLLEVYDDYAHKLLSREDFIAILKLVESYVFRRVICGVPTNSMNKTFATLAKEIDKEQYLASVQAAFLQKDSHRRFPKDEEFRAEFMVKDVYNLQSRNYMLRKLENHGSKEWANIEDYTIEHIMPQNVHLSSQWQEELGPNWKEVHARYLHTIGNLTLTGYNSELSDRLFPDKRDDMKGGFAKSPIRLNQSLATVKHWNEEEIKKRAWALADLAVKVWPMPQLSSEEVSKIVQQAQKVPLAEVMGPIDHPHAGFIPEGFKIIQIKEHCFHYFRQIRGEWVQYSNGKDALYAISWDTAGKSIRDFAKKNTMPLRIGGAVAPPYSRLVADTGSNGYSLEDHLRYMPVDIRGIFERLRKRILNLDSSVKEEVRKRYIAYKATTNFVDIELQKKRLLVTLNIRLSEIDDPKGLCRTITHAGHLSNGDVEVSIHSLDQIEDVMDLIRQAFEKDSEAVYV